MKTIKNLPKDWKDRLEQMGGEGKLPSEMIKGLGITRYLHKKFMMEHDEYRDAYENAVSSSESWWDEEGRSNINTPPKSYNTTLYIWIMKSVFKRRDSDVVVKVRDNGLADEDEQRAIREKYKAEERDSIN